MRIDILTIFPEAFESVLRTSILRIASEKGLVSYHLHDIRDFAGGKRRQVDDRPFGGGPGMLMKVEPVVKCYESLPQDQRSSARTIILTPRGRLFDQPMAEQLAQASGIILICGRYEGFDERVFELMPVEEVSIGQYVLSGGEIAAMAIAEATVRLIPQVLGCQLSTQEESFSQGLLEGPQYTRPRQWRELEVPEVLLSGDHERIAEWRKGQSVEETRKRRSDLYDQFSRRE